METHGEVVDHTVTALPEQMALSPSFTYGNVSSLPREMLFNGDSLLSVAAYAAIFVVAAAGNLTVLITLLRNRHRKSRVKLLTMHLSIADLIVTFVMLPIETGWHLTVEWKAGDVGCRLLMFCRAFGFYLSSFVLVTISVDRYFAIVHPLRTSVAGQRGKRMLAVSWMLAAVASLPQVCMILIFVYQRLVYLRSEGLPVLLLFCFVLFFGWWESILKIQVECRRHFTINCCVKLCKVALIWYFRTTWIVFRFDFVDIK